MYVEAIEVNGQVVIMAFPEVGGIVICLDLMNIEFSGDVALTTASHQQQESLLKMENQ